jgi:uncharacterized membrane protein
MVGTLVGPRLLLPWWRRQRAPAASATAVPILELAAESETLTPRSLALALFAGGAALWISMRLAEVAARLGATVPTILVITVLALILAQVPAVGRLPGMRVLGMYAVYLFLAVVGAFCDLGALAGIGWLGVVLVGFVAVTVVVHGLFVLGGAWVLRLDLESAAVASQANIGGSTSALALAKSLGREDLLLPGILLGAIGNAIGTFLGFAVAGMV